ncbi:MAG: alanyl-tRNA editing protein, partial [Ruminococcaceae bacterium]|nr:alanyl-tRNA editing protein [Oscillospiraceae bacterium]
MIKLYDKDSYIFEFCSEVISCCQVDGEYKILLDQTAFFPTAGGQECDTGTLDEISVVHVEIEEDQVYHYTKKPIEPGKKVIGKIDKEVRLRKMRHHTAEHIVSGLVHSELGLENVGFHLGDEEVTMDYNGVIDHDELLKIEYLANCAVWENIEVDCRYPESKELKNISYRSKLDLSENVRIVTIEGIDICACCAPHVKRTGEIGMIKLKDMINYKG